MARTDKVYSPNYQPDVTKVNVAADVTNSCGPSCVVVRGKRALVIVQPSESALLRTGAAAALSNHEPN